MSVTEVSRQGWGSRLGGAFKGIVVGIVLFIVGFPVLFWNEGRAVKTAKALEQGENEVVSADAAKPDPANEGRLVHVTGLADTKDVLSDSEFGVSTRALRLDRDVQMYQWVEDVSTTTKKEIGGSTTTTKVYSYEKKWVSDPVDSGAFKEAGHDNPAQFPVQAAAMSAENASLGAYRLAEAQIGRIGQEVELQIPADAPAPSIRGWKALRLAGGYYLTPAPASVSNAPIAAEAASAAAVSNAQPAAIAEPTVDSNPVAKIGDVRVTFRAVLPHEISVVAVQKAGTFAAFTASNGRTVELLEDGVHTAEEMFASAKAGNKMLTWIVRLVGFLLMFAGLSMVLTPLSVLGDVLPFLGSLLGMGAKLAAFLAALPCALVTIAVAWFVYRPVAGVILLVAAGASVALLFSRRKKKAAPAAV